MNEHTQPTIDTTTAPAPAPIRGPRTISHNEMREHLRHLRAITLSSHQRHSMFVHHDNTWWVANPDGYIEITDPDQNTKLDRWHRRLTDGALWT